MGSCHRAGLMSLVSFPHKGYGFGRLGLLVIDFDLLLFHPFGDFHEDLVVPPSVPPFCQSIWTTSQNMVQCTGDCSTLVALDHFLVLAAGQSPSAGESSTSLDRSATVPSTIAVTPVPGPITSIDPGRQVRSPSLGAPPLLPHGLFAPRGLFWLWHQPCSTSSHCSVQGPGFPGIPRPRFPGASSGIMLPSQAC